jgi:hypothetical protein
MKELLENEDSDEEMYDYGKQRKKVVSIQYPWYTQDKIVKNAKST